MTDSLQYMAFKDNDTVISRQLDLNIYGPRNKSSVGSDRKTDQGHIDVEQDVFCWENATTWPNF